MTRAHPLGPAGRRGAGQRAGPREGAPGQGGDRPAARLNPPGSPAAVPVTPGARSGAWHRDGTGRQGRCFEDGIRARSKRSMIGEQWWSRRLIDVLESFGMSGRLAWAGTTLVPARSSASRSSGYVTAQVQGSARPYQARIPRSGRRLLLIPRPGDNTNCRRAGVSKIAERPSSRPGRPLSGRRSPARSLTR